EYIPMIKFSFFDPQSASYKTVEKGPFKIEVKQLDKKEDVKIVELFGDQQQDIVKSQELGRDVIYIKDSIGKLRRQEEFLYKNKLLLLLQFLPLVCFFVTVRIYRHFHKIKTDEAYARKLRAPKIARKGLKEAELFLNKSDPHKFYEVIFKTLQRYLGYKLHIPWAGITSDIVNSLSARDIEAGIAGKIKTIMSECDLARYAPSEFNEEKMQRTLEQLRLILDYLERELR
ncbi:MAG: BatD family protein, partial [Candidatus Omnitrophota bacterium]